ncbi:12030_t:CDS:1 [Acaulospora morrowiae]|uniref:Threonylcarbamoyl-AMP synthase n=1 Tax=Acaulospora morrowiae TaxID=94023 RepID=A0A9N8Z9E0_9GLOM|nr:12030_t:CDS:1 [Acaulospora morrowiae]
MDTQVSVLNPNTFTFSTDLEDPHFITTDPNALQILEHASKLLAEDQVIAIPTETVYGLASNALRPEAIKGIYKAKNRPLDNPLIVHISSLKMLRSILPNGEIPIVYESAIKRFWPGPLTILLPKSDLIPSEITCNQPTVAIRFPSHPVARALISKCGFPLAAPSANASGRPSPTLASHVLTDLNKKIPLIIDGGQCSFGVESTVIDAIGTKDPVILRPGGVTYEELVKIPEFERLRVYNKDYVDKKQEIAPTTPGMKYRHYSPNAKMVLVDVCGRVGARDIIEREIQKMVNGGMDNIGILVTGSSKTSNGAQPMSVDNFYSNKECAIINDFKVSTANDQNIIEYTLGDSSHPEEIARELFKGLRYLDERKVDCIIVEGISEEKEGLAVMNRLRKAASKTIVE